MEDRSHSRSLK